MRPETQALFTKLDASGRFHRDSAIGRVFHPGTISYREITTKDSVHLAVRPVTDNGVRASSRDGVRASSRDGVQARSRDGVRARSRISVHVDRYAPLVVRSGRCRYSIVRALAHNVAVAVERCGRWICRHRDNRPTCHLDCEVVWVPDDAPVEDASGEAGSQVA